MKPNPRWSAFWAVLGLVALGGEGTALVLNGSTDSLSAQVWFIVGLSPWVYWPVMAAFGAGGAWMAQHFFGRRP